MFNRAPKLEPFKFGTSHNNTIFSTDKNLTLDENLTDNELTDDDTKTYENTHEEDRGDISKKMLNPYVSVTPTDSKRSSYSTFPKNKARHLFEVHQDTDFDEPSGYQPSQDHNTREKPASYLADITNTSSKLSKTSSKSDKPTPSHNVGSIDSSNNSNNHTSNPQTAKSGRGISRSRELKTLHIRTNSGSAIVWTPPPLPKCDFDKFAGTIIINTPPKSEASDFHLPVNPNQILDTFALRMKNQSNCKTNFVGKEILQEVYDDSNASLYETQELPIGSDSASFSSPAVTSQRSQVNPFCNPATKISGVPRIIDNTKPIKSFEFPKTNDAHTSSFCNTPTSRSINKKPSTTAFGNKTSLDSFSTPSPTPSKQQKVFVSKKFSINDAKNGENHGHRRCHSRGSNVSLPTFYSNRPLPTIQNSPNAHTINKFQAIPKRIDKKQSETFQKFVYPTGQKTNLKIVHETPTKPKTLETNKSRLLTNNPLSNSCSLRTPNSKPFPACSSGLRFNQPSVPKLDDGALFDLHPVPRLDDVSSSPGSVYPLLLRKNNTDNNFASFQRSTPLSSSGPSRVYVNKKSPEIASLRRLGNLRRQTAIANRNKLQTSRSSSSSSPLSSYCPSPSLECGALPKLEHPYKKTLPPPPASSLLSSSAINTSTTEIKSEQKEHTESFYQPFDKRFNASHMVQQNQQTFSNSNPIHTPFHSGQSQEKVFDVSQNTTQNDRLQSNQHFEKVKANSLVPSVPSLRTLRTHNKKSTLNKKVTAAENTEDINESGSQSDVGYLGTKLSTCSFYDCKDIDEAKAHNEKGNSFNNSFGIQLQQQNDQEAYQPYDKLFKKEDSSVKDGEQKQQSRNSQSAKHLEIPKFGDITASKLNKLDTLPNNKAIKDSDSYLQSKKRRLELVDSVEENADNKRIPISLEFGRRSRNPLLSKTKATSSYAFENKIKSFNFETFKKR